PAMQRAGGAAWGEGGGRRRQAGGGAQGAAIGQSPQQRAPGGRGDQEDNAPGGHEPDFGTVMGQQYGDAGGNDRQQRSVVKQVKCQAGEDRPRPGNSMLAGGG